jgi:2,4-dienoyl-CoA reductase-like NADH-dependent reductase (Old Yellow Enzyme family)
MGKKTNQYNALFQPITIGKVEIKNRVAMAPCATHQSTPDGYVSEQDKAWFAARARGGTGLIITCPVMTTPKIAENTPIFNPRLYNLRHKPGMSTLAEVVHSFGAKIFANLPPGGGRQTGGGPSPSAIPIEYRPELMPRIAIREHEKRGLHYSLAVSLQRLSTITPQVLTIDEIVDQENNMANSALLARQCGFDGVELAMAHGHLVHQFFSPRTNKRDDMYGGTFENRTTFAMNIFRKVREKVGDDFCVGFRISGEEHMPGGLSHDEVKKICKRAEPFVNYVHLSDGCYEANVYAFPDEDGTMLKYAESLKGILKIPVLTPSIHDPEMAARAVQEGKTDMVAHGRPLIADPHWANKVAEGKRPVKCIRCNIGCLRFPSEATPIRCMVNPEAGLEQYVPEYQFSRPFKKHWYHE